MFRNRPAQRHLKDSTGQRWTIVGSQKLPGASMEPEEFQIIWLGINIQGMKQARAGD